MLGDAAAVGRGPDVGLSSPESLRRAVLSELTQSSISDWDDAFARKVRFEVTMPKVKGCFLTVTGATVCTWCKSMTRDKEYSW
jgi:hypothetical protein